MITELRILPPLVIGRFGGAPTPMDNYNAVVDPERPLAYRTLEVAATLEVDPESGEITREFVPDRLRFTEDGLVRPVAPFLEVWARREDGELEPLTLELLRAEGVAASDIKWSVRAGNLKMYRRTRDANDKVLAKTEFTDHASHPLEGKCKNFWPGRTVPLGHVRYIRPTAAYPEIRLRFAPAAGHVYGSSETAPGEPRPNDPNVVSVVYDANRGAWPGHIDEDVPGVTVPFEIYAGRRIPGDGWESLGYIDDGCDGIARVALNTGGRRLYAIGRFGAGPPTYAPDSAPLRSVADELEQALLGPDVASVDASPERVEEIVRRAFETIRLMNTAVMNFAQGMAQHDRNYGRRHDPIMAPSLVDDLALEHLHQSLLVALRSGTAPWFGDVLRDYDEVGDLTNLGRRRMPAMMRGADGLHMALTRRQVNLIRALAGGPVFPDAS